MVRNKAEIRSILRAYRAELKKSGIRVVKMFLYGSYARGDAKPYSDIDVVVVSPDLIRFSPLKRQEFLAHKTIPIDAPLEVLGYTSAEFRKFKSTIFGQILHQTGALIPSR
ncbi:MAG: nucleotidyltransferase domain-containing protein [Candidatus Omnitrophica bacterium]|nr:nucleotidyltransferase domain-containing protein [Candidatus Omnitrophota bacterium]